jgi:hypothetical protein
MLDDNSREERRSRRPSLSPPFNDQYVLVPAGSRSTRRSNRSDDDKYDSQATALTPSQIWMREQEREDRLNNPRPQLDLSDEEKKALEDQSTVIIPSSVKEKKGFRKFWPWN